MPATASKDFSKISKVAAKHNGQWNYEPTSPINNSEAVRSNQEVSVDVREIQMLRSSELVVDAPRRHIWWIAQNNVKSASRDTSVELKKPVERLMRVSPSSKPPVVVQGYGVLC